MGVEDDIRKPLDVICKIDDGVAVVTLSNAGGSVLTGPIRAALIATIEKAAREDGVTAIILTGGNDNFATGATPAEEDTPDLGEVNDRIEALDIPVIAAISGAALGAGLELALAAHARVALPDARFGSPDITLGMVPGAGGTQRLPKVVGGVTALKMLLGGRAVNGITAQKIGLVDMVVEGDLIAATKSALKVLTKGDLAARRSSIRRDRLGEGTAFLEAVAAHRRAADRSPLEAPARMIECVEAALLLPYEIGRGLEIAAHEDLLDSDHSRALRHSFTAERRLQAITKSEGRVPSRPLNAVGLVGAGRIGSELAVTCLDAGFVVTVAEQSDEALEAGVMRIIEQYDARVAANKMSEETVETILDRMNAVCGYRTLSDADVVIDPSPVMTRARIAELDSVMKAGAILLTGAERADIGTIAKATGRETDIIGFRLQPGVNRNRVVEIAAGPKTGERAMATARALARKLDRLIVFTGAKPEGIGRRISNALHAAADTCVEDGARIAQVDAVLRDWGLPLGSYAWRDALGLNKRSDRIYDAYLAQAGRTGRAAGKGFYHYPAVGKPGVEDPTVAAVFDDERRERGVTPRTLSDAEVRKRCVAAMAGAGAHMLADGTARRPSDIDMVAIHGLGFARRTGGVMFAADLLGLKEVRRLLGDMAQKSQLIAPPSPILTDLMKADQTFEDLNN